MIFDEVGICFIVVFFGGVCILEFGCFVWVVKNEMQCQNLEVVLVYYDEVCKFVWFCLEYLVEYEYCEFVVVMGGGLGVMEVGNWGVYDVYVFSIGFNIVLLYEQVLNFYVMLEFSFNFYYFVICKMYFIMCVKVVVVFFGGFGMMDEFFEMLMFIQMGCMECILLIFFGEKFWCIMVNFDVLVDFGIIVLDDIKLFNFVEMVDEVWVIIEWYYCLLGNGGV